MEYKVGNTVTIKSYEDIYAEADEVFEDNDDCKTDNCYFPEGMKKYCGKTLRITQDLGICSGKKYNRYVLNNANGYSFIAPWFVQDKRLQMANSLMKEV